MLQVISTSGWARAAEEQGASSTPGGVPPAAAAAAAAEPPAAAAGAPAPPPPSITRFLGFAGLLPFYAFSPVVAPYLPLDLILEPHLLANPGALFAQPPATSVGQPMPPVAWTNRHLAAG